MKKLFFFVLVIIGIISCDNNYDVVVRMENGVICKYKCKQDTDTTDCTKYCFYNNNLISQSTYVDGKLNGSAIDYYPDGLIYILMNYHNDKMHGIKKVFDEYGTLLRRSLYLQDKQVLFESTMINTKNEHLRRKQLIALVNGQKIWSGEKYIVINDSSLSMDSYQGIFVEIMVDDTIAAKTFVEMELDITFPKVICNTEIIIGKFNESLSCIDTLFYVKLDSIPDLLSFNYETLKTGNDYLIGRLSVPDTVVKEDIYFFKGFYVK